MTQPNELRGGPGGRPFPPLSARLLGLHALILLIWQGLQIPGGPWHLPLDDAYIHLAYARTLALSGVWGFHPGEASAGATSLLWPLLETPGWWLGRPEVWAWTVSATWLLILGHMIWRLIHAVLPEHPPSVQVLAWAVVALQGHFFLLGLSGMESVAFVACGLGVFLLIEENRWKTAGALAFLAALLRPEGFLVGAAAAVWALARGRFASPGQMGESGTSAERPGVSRAEWRGLAWVAIPTAAAFGIYAAVNWAAGGHALPTTYGGRSQLVFADHPGFAGRLILMAKFPVSWVHHVLYYALGGKMLEAVGSPTLGVAKLAIVAGLILAGGLVLLFRDLRRNRATPGGRILLSLLLWTLLHNGLYWVMLPTRGNAGRYQAMNFLWVGLGLAWILLWLFQHPSRRFDPGDRSLARSALIGGVATILLSAIPLWCVQYYCSRRIETVYVATTRYLKNPASPPGAVAVFDIGYLGCFGGRRIVDLGGLLHNDPEIWSDPRAYAIRQGAALRIYQGDDFDPSPDNPERHGDRVVNGAVYRGPLAATLQQAMAGATNGMVILEIVKEEGEGQR